MAWLTLVSILLALGAAMIVSRVRRSDLEADEATLTERGEAKDRGSHKPQLQYPQIDLTLCLGCGTCIKACPEDGVLGLIHGQAAVIHGARCVGIAACAIACPPGAIAVRIEDLENRKDIPALTDDLEVIGVPGLFLAGEVTGFALVRTAVMHGQKVANQVAERVATPVAATAGATAGGIAGAGDILDLCIIGCGPAGFSCSLQSKAKGLNFATIEREEIGGTVAKYPRRKLVMTQPMDLPLHGRLKKLTYLKEELMEIWLDLAREHDLPIHTGEAFLGIERDSQGVFTVKTKSRSFRARHVCFCLGRRGTPRKLGVPGEELPKVLYSLVDAQSFEGRHILVVGGGDSAIEAAVGLSEQPGNTVTLSYRKSSFFRMKAKNEKRITEAEATGRIDVIFESQVLEISEKEVLLERKGEDGEKETFTLENDDVFIFAGGIPPFKLLEEAGVSFDPSRRAPAAAIEEQGTGLKQAILIGLGLVNLTVLWFMCFSSYYSLPLLRRPESSWHDTLKPTGVLGITLGIVACLLIVANLLYLIRRSDFGKWLSGSLQDWLSWHMVTGVLAMLLVLVHAGLIARHTPGGHALVGLFLLTVSGVIGRYFYTNLPRTANKREEEFDRLQSQVEKLSGDWEIEGVFGERVREIVKPLLVEERWRSSLWDRLLELFGDRPLLRMALARIRHAGLRENRPEEEIARVMSLAVDAHRTASITARTGELRGILGSWRFIHRWLALLMVLLAVIHIVTALNFGNVL